MGTTLYRTATSAVTSHRFKKATCKVALAPSQSVVASGYRLADVTSSWFIHRALKNGSPSPKGWSVTHAGIGKSLGHTFDTLDAAKSLVLSLATSTGTDTTPALDATPFGHTTIKLEALTELRRVKAVFDGWLRMKRDEESFVSAPTAEPALPRHDPEPQPGDGPDYHAEHAYWKARQSTPATAPPHP